METPRTSKGKFCKLCKKSSAGVCHMHGRTSPKRSPNTKSGSFDSALGSHKKSSSKRSPLSKFEYFDDLPYLVLEEVLLKLDRKELNVICNSNRRAKDICDSKSFRERYVTAHPKIFYEVLEVDAFEGSKVLYTSNSLENAKKYYNSHIRDNPNAFYRIFKTYADGRQICVTQ